MSIFTKLKVGQKWTYDNAYGNPFGQKYRYDEVVAIEKGWVKYIHYGGIEPYLDCDKIFDFLFIRKQIK